MKMLAVIGLFALGSAFAAAPKPSGPLKSFKGPEGEVITLVEVNDSKQMLVHMKGVGGEVEGKSLLYNLAEPGRGKKDLYVDKKRGSKTFQSFIMTNRDGRWHFYHPTKAGTEFDVSYSEEASEKTKLEDVLKAYKP